MIDDSARLKFREVYYSLFVGLLWQPLEASFAKDLAENHPQWTEAALDIDEGLGEAWGKLGTALDELGPSALAEEFSQLFLNPFGQILQPFESMILTGQFYAPPLAEVKGFMKKIGLEKDEETFKDPEDALVFELSIMLWMIGKQTEAKTDKARKKWLDFQMDFLRTRLFVWGPEMARMMAQCGDAHLYSAVGQMLEAFLRLEQEAFEAYGMGRVETLAEAQQRHGKKIAWKGELADPAAEDGKLS